MIKFFRKIRQNLLMENKTGKYLKYAIGEIVLVVIGILIAFGINQSVKERNNLELRNAYINQLNNEADRNIKELNDLKIKTNDLIKDVNTLIKILKNQEYDNPELASKSMTLINMSEFYPITTTYENLKFSGDLKLFSDLNLRNAISKPYETFNHIHSVETIDIS